MWWNVCNGCAQCDTVEQMCTASQEIFRIQQSPTREEREREREEGEVVWGDGERKLQQAEGSNPGGEKVVLKKMRANDFYLIGMK